MTRPNLMILTSTGLLLLLMIAGCTKNQSANTAASYSCPECNVVLICIDTLRADHLGCYGHSHNTSPNIDTLAGQACLFSNAYSTSSWTFPSHFSLFTSKYPNTSDHIVYPQIKRFDDSHVTLSEVLKSQGYDTVAFTGGGFVAAELGFSQGFDAYVTHGRRFEQNFDQMSEWLAGHDPARKFMLFFHGYNTHRPYHPPENLVNKYIDEIPDECKGVTFKDQDPGWGACLKARGGPEYRAAQYDSEIYFVDAMMGELFRQLKENGLYENSIIIITSDHGEELGDHGGSDHINTLYQELIKVPFILRVPHADAQVIQPERFPPLCTA